VTPRNNVLIHQDNGMGGTADLSYVPSTDPSTAGTGCVGGTNSGAPCMSNAECTGGGTCVAPSPDSSQLPFATWVVQTLTLHSGMTATGNDLTTIFAYTNGYFDPWGHQFRGFRQSVEARADGRKIRRQFAPPPFTLATSPPWYTMCAAVPFKLIGQDVWSGAQLLSRTTQDWATTSLDAGRSQIHPTKRVDTTYSTAPGVTTTKTRTQTFDTYDAYNNQTQDTVTADPADNVPAIITKVAYGASAPCHGQPTQITVSSNSLALSDKLFLYDAKCNLTMVQQKLAAAGQSASNGTVTTTTRLDYDQSIDGNAAKAGQPTRVLDARGVAANPNYGTTLTYVCSRGLFPCTITNALNQVTQKTYDLRWGKPTQITEPNSAVTGFGYDNMGRLTSLTRPLDTTAWRQFVYTYGTGGGSPTPSRIDTLVREPNATSGTRTVSAFYDNLGRLLETKQQQYVSGSATAVVQDAVAFDNAGRVVKRYVPFTASSGVTTYTSPSPGNAGTLVTYDALDRITRTTNPDGTYRTADYGTAGQITSLDENYNECATATGKTASCPGAKTVEYGDALGRVVKTELSEGSTLKTRSTNAYDGLNRVTSAAVTDPTASPPKTATTTFEYDSLSRRTKLTDPDSGPVGPSPPAAPGAWSYAYDKAGNLVYQNDPKTNQHIEFCYDALNRVSRKLYPSGDAQLGGAAYTTACGSSSPGMPYLKYLYDVQSAYSCDANGIGRLCAVDESLADGSFLRTIFVYDARGRVNYEYGSRSISGKVGSYTRTNVYDVADRLWKITYPTNFSSTSETVQYTYDDLGQLDLVSSGQQTYANGMSYDVFGRIKQWNDGSGLVNTAAFGNSSLNYRLTQLRVTDAGGATVYEQFDYSNVGNTTYDVAGNLKLVTDSTPTSRYAANSPLRSSWAYAYDGIGRLTSAQLGSATATTFGYDGLGNMTRGNQLTFAYTDTVHPHHMTSLTPGGGTSYHEDGGLASRGDTDGAQPDLSKSVAYDADGRVATVSTGDGHLVRSIYDFRGERVGRIVDEGTGGQVNTFYYGKWFEVTGGTLTRHMYLHDRLIADSPVAAPSGLTLASISEEERSIMLARAMRDATRWSPSLYPNYVLTTEEAAKLGVFVAFVLLAVGCAPGRVRVGLAVARNSPFRRLRSGHVIVVVVVFGLTLTPLTCVRPVHAGGGSSGPPPNGSTFPIYFLHADHLGSTVMLTCYKQGTTCPDGAVARYYRYDAYGQTKAYDVNGNAVAPGTALIPQSGVSYVPERLYTGQRWDWQAQVYYYGARFYDPRVAGFLAEDPLLGLASPYSYVAWGPVRHVDPTGAVLDADFAIGASFAAAAAFAAFVPGAGLPALGGLFSAFAAYQSGNATAGTVFAAFAVGVIGGPAGGFLGGAVGNALVGRAVTAALGSAIGTLVEGKVSGQEITAGDVAVNALQASLIASLSFGVVGAADLPAAVQPLAGVLSSGALRMEVVAVQAFGAESDASATSGLSGTGVIGATGAAGSLATAGAFGNFVGFDIRGFPGTGVPIPEGSGPPSSPSSANGRDPGGAGNSGALKDARVVVSLEDIIIVGQFGGLGGFGLP
jgi:RHS repeat-associated protein